MAFNPFSGRGLLAIGSLGTSELLGEDTMSKIPVLNAIGGYQSDEQRALMQKQEQLAKEAEAQAKRNQQARMQALGQSMLAFNPQNQMMAQMFGPQAAFSPQQFAQMAGDPGAKSLGDAEAAWQAAAKASAVGGQPSGAIPPQVQADLERARENERRKRMLLQQMQPVGPGPAPLSLPTPQAGRRF